MGNYLLPVVSSTATSVRLWLHRVLNNAIEDLPVPDSSCRERRERLRRSGHSLVIDGIYRLRGGKLAFQYVASPTTDESARLVRRIAERVMKCLTPGFVFSRGSSGKFGLAVCLLNHQAMQPD